MAGDNFEIHEHLYSQREVKEMAKIFREAAEILDPEDPTLDPNYRHTGN
jgi:hypothetical protein